MEHLPANILAGLSGDHPAEEFLTLIETPGVRIERIASHAHASSEGFWYDQDCDEWVLVLQGEAVLEFDPPKRVEMRAGDHLFIPRHTRHRVERTSNDTVWLAVHLTP